MKQYITIPLLCLLALLSVGAAHTAYKPTYENSSVTFDIKNAGLNVQGTFKEFECEIHFSPEKPESGSVKATIKAGSIDTGIEARDTHLRKEEFFGVDTHPSITFVSTSIVASASGNYIANGNLTIKGITKAVKLPFTFTPSSTGGLFRGYLNLNRRDYGVGGKSVIMADELKASFSIDTVKE